MPLLICLYCGEKITPGKAIFHLGEPVCHDCARQRKQAIIGQTNNKATIDEVRKL